MQTISVRTTQNVTIDHPVASLGDRIGAYFIDLVVMIAYAIIVVVAFINIDVPAWLYIAFLVIPLALYHLLFEIFMNGQSPGKRAMNIQVVKLDGTEPGFAQYFLRWLFALIEGGAIAVLVIAVSGKGQRLGDIVAGTSVVKLIDYSRVTARNVFIQPDQNYIVTFPQASNLHSRDIELIQRSVEAYKQFGNIEPVMLATEKIKSILQIQSDLQPVDFLYTIVKDYNHLNSI